MSHQMTHQEVKTYLILKYGSMDKAVDVYVGGNQTGLGDDYEIMRNYFRRYIDRIYNAGWQTRISMLNFTGVNRSKQGSILLWT